MPTLATLSRGQRRILTCLSVLIRKMHLPSFRPFYSIDGLTFDQAWETAELVFVDEVPVRYISCENLILNKLAVARPQDLVDVDKLRHARETKRRHSTKSARQ